MTESWNFFFCKFSEFISVPHSSISDIFFIFKNKKYKKKYITLIRIYSHRPNLQREFTSDTHLKDFFLLSFMYTFFFSFFSLSLAHVHIFLFFLSLAHVHIPSPSPPCMHFFFSLPHIHVFLFLSLPHGCICLFLFLLSTDSPPTPPPPIKPTHNPSDLFGKGELTEKK